MEIKVTPNVKPGETISIKDFRYDINMKLCVSESVALVHALASYRDGESEVAKNILNQLMKEIRSLP